MVKPPSAQAGAASRRAEFGVVASPKAPAAPSVRKARARAAAPPEDDLAAADATEEIRITREGFRATPRDDRAG